MYFKTEKKTSITNLTVLLDAEDWIANIHQTIYCIIVYTEYRAYYLAGFVFSISNIICL